MTESWTQYEPTEKPYAMELPRDAKLPTEDGAVYGTVGDLLVINSNGRITVEDPKDVAFEYEPASDDDDSSEYELNMYRHYKDDSDDTLDALTFTNEEIVIDKTSIGEIQSVSVENDLNPMYSFTTGRTDTETESVDNSGIAKDLSDD